MIDEPDAHLEILRQKQIFAILNSTIQTNKGQVIIATHSEAILDEAVDKNLTLLLQGEATNLAKQQNIKNTLRTYGIEHYYKAKVQPRILYLEGSTDREILTALAERIGHQRAKNILMGRLNTYYIKNIEPDNTLDNQLERLGGAFGNHTTHFFSLKEFVPELKGFGLFDGDNLQRPDKIENVFATVFWKEYEIENYFITPDVLLKYAANVLDEDVGPLFRNTVTANVKDFESVIHEILLETIFGGDKNQLDEYLTASTGLKRTLLKTWKMSQFAEDVFKRYSGKFSKSLLLAKRDFYKLVFYCPVDEIPEEVNKKLDLLAEYLEYGNG
jgi:hypothetical protein